MPAAIARRSVDKVDAEIERPMQRRDRFIVIRRSIGAGHAHATERQMRDFKLRRAELYVLHNSSVPPRQLSQVEGQCQTYLKMIAED